jgi:Anti-sigma-K factor rskA
MRRELTDFERLRAQELLVSRATEGLDDDERDELDGYGANGIGGFDDAAAFVDVVTLPRASLPPALADKIFKAAVGVIKSSTTAPAVPAVAATFTRSLPAVFGPARPVTNRRSRTLLFAGWAMAAAAAVLAVIAWSSRGDGRSEAPSPMGMRTELTHAPDSTVFRWEGSLAGDVVWSGARQHGVIQIRGLAPNDPQVSRYQVWLVDQTRDERYPVDGGLFDTSATETVFAFTPRIAVGRLTQVVITAEGPKGVVVSDRARVVASTAGR